MPIKANNNNSKEKLDHLTLEQTLYTRDCRIPKIKTF